MAWNFLKIRPTVLWARWTGFLRRRYYSKHNLRPASWPFLSGDSFRALARLSWDETDEAPFSADEVRNNDVIFVSWHVFRFLTELAPQIKVPFYLITSNSDYAVRSADVENFQKTPGKHWWAANLTVRSETVSLIPLGLQNERFCWIGDVADFLIVQKRSQLIPKENKICWGFTVGTNAAERGPVRDALQKNPLAVELPSMDPYSYRRELIKYQFVASPPGNGPDCHRTWEALALGVSPVLLRSEFSEQLLEQGYGVILLDRADEFSNFPAKR